MNASIIFWVIVILILIILWGIHIRRCCKYFDSITQRRRRERRVQRRVLQTITINVGRPPYTIEGDLERGGRENQPPPDRKIDKDLPTYEEAMEEDLRRVVNQTSVSPNQPPPPPRY